MVEKQCIYCNSVFIGEGNVCNRCKLEGKEETEKKVKLVATVETLALLRDMKDKDGE